MKPAFIISILVIILQNNNTVYGQDYIGYYVTPKISFGFFRTKIAINNDSTFYYNFSGDLVYEERNGKYFIQKNKLYFDLPPNYDTIYIYYKDMKDFKDFDTTLLPKPDPIIMDINKILIKQYLIKRNKLIPISDEGKVLRKAKLKKIDKDQWDKMSGIGIRKIPANNDDYE